MNGGYSQMARVLIATHNPTDRPRRVSSDSVWPLRCADGRTFAERKQKASDT